MSSADKVKLGGLSNYNDTEIRGLITELKTAFDAMMSGDTTNAIKTFNEVIAFLDSIKDTESLSGIISGISTDIENVRADIPTNNNELENGAGYITANDIPEQVQADWNATSGVSYIQNKPELKPVAISGSYNDLADTPTSLPANGGNADTVNGFTVGTNVPADAKFTDTVYNDSAIRSEIAKAIKPTLITQVSTLTSMPINNYSIKATVNANTAISFAQTPEEGMEYMIDILSTAAFTQALPNSGGWQSNEGSLNVEAGKVASISIRYIHGIYVVRV